MGEEVKSSKSFLIAVAVLLALVVFVSYWGDSTGQATRSQSSWNWGYEECTTTIYGQCSRGPANAWGYGPTIIAAEADANAKCEEDKKTVKGSYNNCILLFDNNCPAPCNVYTRNRKDTTGTACRVNRDKCEKLDDGRVACYSIDGEKFVELICKK